MSNEVELITGLPNDIARECLIRIPSAHLNSTRTVCKRWNQEINSRYFHRIRKTRKISKTIIVFAQADPAMASSGPARRYHNSPISMTFKLTAFDTSSATWGSLPPIPGMPRGLPMFCQLASAGWEVVVLGGWDPVTWSPIDCVYVYSFVTGKWRKGAGMPGPKRSFYACTGSGHESGRVVLVSGGHDEVNSLQGSAIMYDVKTDGWSSIPDMGLAGDQCRGIYEHGSFHTVGGFTGGRQGRLCNLVESLDDGHVAVLEGGTWRDVWGLPDDADVETMMVTWEGKMLAIGSDGYGGARKGYVMEFGNKTWEKIELPFEFSGYVQAACCLQI